MPSFRLFAVAAALLAGVALAAAAAAAAAAASEEVDLSASTPPLYVAAVFRHGHRAPGAISPRSASAWAAAGYVSGQLTDIGIAMHVAFGSYLRTTYVKGASGGAPAPLAYLPFNYTYHNLNVRSTDVDRCLMSVDTLLSQLYPGIPFPIHTVPVSDEWLLQMVDHNPAYNIEYIPIYAKWDEILTQPNSIEADMIAAITAWTGFAPNYEDAANLMYDAYDNWQCGSYIGVPIDNAWLAANFDFFMNVTRNISHDQYGMTGLDDPRGTVGWPLMSELLTQFRAHAHLQTPPPFMSLYSAHDTTLTALWSALGLLDASSAMNTPDFAQSVVFELRAPVTPGVGDVAAIDDYVLTMKVGAPQSTDPVRNSAFTYSLKTVPIPCGGPTPVLSCTIGNFTRHVNTLMQPDGACLRMSPQFELQNCNNYTSPTAFLPEPCQLYRQWCPLQACESGQTLNAAVDPTLQSCQAMIVDTELSQDQRAMWLAIGGGIMAGVFMIGMCVYCACWAERSSGGRDGRGDSVIGRGVTGAGGGADRSYAALSPDNIGSSPMQHVNK